jgi:hypothetical protein
MAHVSRSPAQATPEPVRVETNMTKANTEVMDRMLPVIEHWLREFAGQARAFGRPGMHKGYSDDAHGVQWNAGVNPDGSVTVGANLEGMKYDDWPIARFLLRERRTPGLVAVLHRLAEAERVEVWLQRDAWQATSRPDIDESFIGNRPLAATSLDEKRWLPLVEEALKCLDASKGHRGRAEQTVTTKTGKRLMPVTPHLQVKYVVPDDRLSQAGLEHARTVLRPVHEYVTRQAAI